MPSKGYPSIWAIDLRADGSKLKQREGIGCCQLGIGTARRSTIDGDEKLRGELGLGKSEPHMPRKEDGEQEGGLASSPRVSSVAEDG